jgi:hypothetical protein
VLQVRFRRLECHDESERIRYSTCRLPAQQIDGFHSHVFKRHSRFHAIYSTAGEDECCRSGGDPGARREAGDVWLTQDWHCDSRRHAGLRFGLGAG